MTIAICASMRFLKEMEEVENKLLQMGFQVFVPEGLILHRKKNWTPPKTSRGKIESKIKYDFIRKHFQKIEKSDAVLVLNYTKDGIKNYIGPNSFLEIGIAYYLHKKIFLLNPIPKTYLWEELSAMKPEILNGKLNKFKKYANLQYNKLKHEEELTLKAIKDFEKEKKKGRLLVAHKAEDLFK